MLDQPVWRQQEKEGKKKKETCEDWCAPYKSLVSKCGCWKQFMRLIHAKGNTSLKTKSYTGVCRLCPQNMPLLFKMSSRRMLSVQWINIKKKKNIQSWIFFIKQTYFTCFASFGSFAINNNSGSLGTNKTSFRLKSSYSQPCSDSLLSPCSTAGGHDSHASIRRYWSFGLKLFLYKHLYLYPKWHMRRTSFKNPIILIKMGGQTFLE